MIDASFETLLSAIARNRGAVLTLPLDDMVRHCKTWFLSENSEGFWIESDPAQGSLIDDLIIKAVPVGISFKHGPTKSIFTTHILRRQPDFQVNREMALEALLLRFPLHIKSVQRRSNYRVTIPASCDISIRVWQIPDHWVIRDKPPATMAVQARLRDLSVSGAGMLIPPKDNQPVCMVRNTRLRVQLEYADIDTVFEARVQQVRPTPDHSLRVGVQFKKLEDDLDGRHILSRLTTIVGELRRAEVRRLRMDIPG
ncbi:MAG: PilZ domain-containing protein [Planctomycetota bacterium]|nr:PilZ domain-containing protein [Planctomycetota bacterium]